MNDKQKKEGWSDLPRLVISSPQGHSGKTVVASGLCALLRSSGHRVQPFKRGPDYIDPSWLTAAAGRTCRNLDTILMPEKAAVSAFLDGCRGADVAVVEGAMGLYDSPGISGRGSTASLAHLLKSPVLLVVNASHMTRSVAALVNGFQHFEPDINIPGVILNNVSGQRHEQKLIRAVEQYCGIPVVGSLPRDENFNLAERHLGLVTFGEESQQNITTFLSSSMGKYLDLGKILCIAGDASPIETDIETVPETRSKCVRIGVIKDRIFSFYYPENLESLEKAGAKLVFIDSTLDSRLPEIDALYIGGGFPELYLPELEANDTLRRDIAQAVANSLPVYAECAGLMYLCRSITWKGKDYEMVGALPASVEMFPRPQGHGYVHVRVERQNTMFPVNMTFWGHEFHHSKLHLSTECEMVYRVSRGNGIAGGRDGIVYRGVLATYVHLHSLGVPAWAEALVRLAAGQTGGLPLFESAIRQK